MRSQEEQKQYSSTWVKHYLKLREDIACDSLVSLFSGRGSGPVLYFFPRTHPDQSGRSSL